MIPVLRPIRKIESWSFVMKKPILVPSMTEAPTVTTSVPGAVFSGMLAAYDGEVNFGVRLI